MNDNLVRKADIVEVFSSVQGEGLCIGERHLFVRFKDCNLMCAACDEQHTHWVSLSSDELAAKIDEIEKEQGPHTFISLTGGEPLCYAEFIQDVYACLNEDKRKLYLETNGTLPEELKNVIELVSLVSVDIKLNSVWGQGDFHAIHKAFLDIANTKNVFVKVVVSNTIDLEEFRKYIELIVSVSADIPLVIQPLEDMISGAYMCSSSLLYELQQIALQKLVRVVILPRIHTVLNMA